MDVCLNCGSDRFEEENGLYFCLICQTQRQGLTQEVAQDFIAEDVETGEVSQKRKKKIISTGVLWTTTEAFNYILLSQVNALIDSGIVSTDFKEMVLTIWCAYLRYCEIAFWNGNHENRESKLHSAARFRDIQILRTKCDEVPLYKYAKSSTPKRRRIRFGNRVLKPKRRCNAVTSEDTSESENELDLHYKTLYYKRDASQRLFTAEMRKQIQKIVYGDFNELQELPETESSNDDEDIMVTERCKKLKTIYNSGYLSVTKHIHSSNDCFVGILTLPKTLAILNLAFRLCNKDIYTGDLLLWIKQGTVPYFNTLINLPNDWKVLASDCRTFVPTTSPTHQNIDTATVKLGTAVGLKCLPTFNYFALIERYVEDLNLPLVLTDIMKFQNVFKTAIFTEKLLKTIPEMKKLPPFEVIALMSIVMMLKRLFGLDGKSEKFLSTVARRSHSNFVWQDWEYYTRLRLDCLKHYYVPIHDQGDSIRDVSSVVNFYSEVAEQWRPKNILSHKKDESPFRNNFRNIFQTLANKSCPRNTEQSLSKSSVFHLNSATDAILQQVGPDLRSKLTVDFRTKDLSYIEEYCIIYTPLKIGSAGCKVGIHAEENWSHSFRLLLEVSCVILQCKIRDLFITLNQLERVFLKHHWKMIRKKE